MTVTKSNLASLKQTFEEITDKYQLDESNDIVNWYMNNDLPKLGTEFWQVFDTLCHIVLFDIEIDCNYYIRKAFELIDKISSIYGYLNNVSIVKI